MLSREFIAEQGATAVECSMIYMKEANSLIIRQLGLGIFGVSSFFSCESVGLQLILLKVACLLC